MASTCSPDEDWIESDASKGPFGVEASVAVGAGVLLHAISVLPLILLGLILLRADRMPFNDLLLAGRQIRDMGAAPTEDGT